MLRCNTSISKSLFYNISFQNMQKYENICKEYAYIKYNIPKNILKIFIKYSKNMQRCNTSITDSIFCNTSIQNMQKFANILKEYALIKYIFQKYSENIPKIF